MCKFIGTRGKRKHKKGSKDKLVPWNSASVWYVLRNTIHYGVYFAKNGTREWKVEAPFLMTKARWDQIGEKAEVNTLRPRKEEKKQSDESGDFWLKTLLRCGPCIQMGAKKARMTTQRIKKKNKEGYNRHYYCLVGRQSQRKSMQAV
ncbi:MAG: recombinase family protein [Thermodesulfobacteriota bacterium]